VLIGIDFDNTIVCYDELFHAVARERGLIPDGVAVTKNAVRDHLRQAGAEDRWTQLQGYVYGPGMKDAKPFPGVLPFFAACRRLQRPVFIISHRTRHPFLGEKHDLHQSARDWIAAQGLHDPQGLGLPEDRVFFEPTKAEKLARIASVGCTHFIDDLPELLQEPTFPAGVEKILFDPGAAQRGGCDIRSAASWEALARMLIMEKS